ncbi:MAG: hypothetical protein FWD55_01685 [Propionibacteriaceae bacterium]|nr:hypothetical protein [Propionibacteriaceae bacterium]
MTRQPNYAVPTGEFIWEWIDDNDVPAAELATRLGVTHEYILELLSGKAALTANLAMALESVTGIPADHWNRLEALYQADLIRLAKLG